MKHKGEVAAIRARPNIAQFQGLKISRSTFRKCTKFLDRWIFRLWNCEMFDFAEVEEKRSFSAALVFFFGEWEKKKKPTKL